MEIPSWIVLSESRVGLISACLFAILSTAAVAQTQPPTGVPSVISECEEIGSVCIIPGTWTWSNGSFSAYWPENGAQAIITIQSFVPSSVVLRRVDIPGSPGFGQSYTYTGTFSVDGSGLATLTGTETWTFGSGGSHPFSASWSVPAGSLTTPTNLQATQVPDTVTGIYTGTQIQLTWDYGTDPVDGFTIQRKTPTGPWQTIPMVFTSTDRTFTDTVSVPWGTYSYQIQAYQNTTTSDYSNQADCFQIEVETLSNTTAIRTLFTPDVVGLDQVAQVFGFDHFNWVSEIVYGPSILQLQGGWPFSVHVPPPPILDPPLGGWPRRPADGLPYYWDEQPGFDPQYSIDTWGGGTSGLLAFADQPKNPILQFTSDFVQFQTFLVGVKQLRGDPASLPPQFVPIASFSWSSNFTGSAGGITDWSLSDVSPPITPGTGGIFNVQIVQPEDAPLNVRSLLIQSGAEN
jgi:hypothetical protein